MRNLGIQSGKLKRLIALNGKSYTFYRDQLNDLGEPNGGTTEVASVPGLWHESQSYIQVSSGDSATTRSKPSPQILALFEDAKDIKQDDYLMVGSNKYIVTGTHDPTKLGIAIDISLEVVL